jgi:hypothetical protein
MTMHSRHHHEVVDKSMWPAIAAAIALFALAAFVTYLNA